MEYIHFSYLFSPSFLSVHLITSHTTQAFTKCIHNYVQHLVTHQASTTASKPLLMLHSVIMVEVYLEALFPGAEVGGVVGGGEGGGRAVLEFSVEPLIL